MQYLFIKMIFLSCVTYVTMIWIYSTMKNTTKNNNLINDQWIVHSSWKNYHDHGNHFTYRKRVVCFWISKRVTVKVRHFSVSWLCYMSVSLSPTDHKNIKIWKVLRVNSLPEANGWQNVKCACVWLMMSLLFTSRVSDFNAAFGLFYLWINMTKVI